MTIARDRGDEIERDAFEPSCAVPASTRSGARKGTATNNFAESSLQFAGEQIEPERGLQVGRRRDALHALEHQGREAGHAQQHERDAHVGCDAEQRRPGDENEERDLSPAGGDQP